MKEKVAIITGITKGIGLKTALNLAKSGTHIIGSYKSDDVCAEVIHNRIVSCGVSCELIKGDLKNSDVVDRIIKTARLSDNFVSYLVNNASHYERYTYDKISETCYMDMLKINMVAPFLLIRGIAPIMIENKYGSIVNISTANANKGYLYASHYNSAKAGVQGLTVSLAKELSPYIRVNCVSPGFIETTMISMDSETERAKRLELIPMNRIGKASDVANLICFLLDDSSDYITGQIISVSGGY